MPNNRAAFEAEGQAIIQAIDDYHARTGAYPKSLSAAGISERSPYGPWRYRLFDGEYGLSLGDYGACQWEFTFSSKTRSWYYDS